MGGKRKRKASQLKTSRALILCFVSQRLDVDRAQGERIQLHVKEGEWFDEHDDLLQLHLSGCDYSVDLAIKSLIQGKKLRWKLLCWNVKDGKEGKEETSWDELMDPDFTWFVAQLELQQGDNRASGDCWQSAVDGFRARINAKPKSESLHFVSLMIPAADMGRVTEHFVYEEDGFVVDPMMVLFNDDRTSLTCDTYYGALEESTERLGIRPYACSPLRLNKKQFDLLLNIVALSLEIVPSNRTLANCRACAAALIDIWDEAESEQRIAERVIARVHGVTVRLKPKEK